MGLGTGNLQTLSRNDPTVIPPPGPPFLLTSADNGISVDPVSFKIVLGQSLGAVGDPAQLLDDREIPMNGFTFSIGKTTEKRLFIDSVNDLYQFGDISAMANNLSVQVDDAGNMIGLGKDPLNTDPGLFLDFAHRYYALGDDFQNNNGVELVADDNNNRIQGIVTTGGFAGNVLLLLGNPTNRYAIGDVGLHLNGTQVVLDDLNSIAKLGDTNAKINGTQINVDDVNGKLSIFNTANTSFVSINGVNGFTGTVTPVTTITVDGGIVTNVA